MTYQSTFKRYEFKYILESAQKLALMDALEGRMKIDSYGRTTIRNIYFDTDNFRLIRLSLDKPSYKEKLRVRSYKKIENDDEVFVELKKKCESIVYKRRVSVPETLAMDWLVAGGNQPGSSQVEDEIEYFREFYKEISPKVFISYEREAFYSTDNTNIRLTLDSNILARDYDLSLRYGVHGDSIIDEDKTILEVKVSDTIPMWLIRFLRDNNIQKTSFSKYGMYYGGKKYA
ncbi:MAG TPA: polyphosphate polymerase domain-containing protein [Saccharofermentans sp.]|nr:polyphosphate polymerase domain-containing protein [Saccharofermentans sp.]HPE27317.1 polyphosphate polymerase domain-containing protein [Saccharofermentans sp.]